MLTSLDPSVCPLFCSENIPSEENQFAGQNWTFTDIPEADDPLRETETNPIDEERSAAMAEADELLAESATSIPLDPLPNILILSEQVVGEVVNHPIYGPFYNMEGWGLS